MLTREERKEIKDALAKKAEINDNIKYNNDEIKKLKDMFMVEANDRNCKLIQLAIKRGERIISTQKTEALSLAASKIAKTLGVDRNQVRYQETLFNRERIVL